MIVQIQIYLLNETQKNQILQINNETNNYAIVCNYGTGDCISAEIDTMEGFEEHSAYIQSQGIPISEAETEEN